MSSIGYNYSNNTPIKLGDTISIKTDIMEMLYKVTHRGLELKGTTVIIYKEHLEDFFKRIYKNKYYIRKMS